MKVEAKRGEARSRFSVGFLLKPPVIDAMRRSERYQPVPRKTPRCTAAFNAGSSDAVLSDRFH